MARSSLEKCNTHLTPHGECITAQRMCSIKVKLGEPMDWVGRDIYRNVGERLLTGAEFLVRELPLQSSPQHGSQLQKLKTWSTQHRCGECPFLVIQWVWAGFFLLLPGNLSGLRVFLASWLVWQWPLSVYSWGPENLVRFGDFLKLFLSLPSGL